MYEICVELCDARFHVEAFKQLRMQHNLIVRTYYGFFGFSYSHPHLGGEWNAIRK